MISRRSLEVLTAALTGTFGVAVCISSLDLGIAWNSAGVSPGTLPFCTGLVITAGSLFNLVSGALTAQGETAIDADNAQRLAGLFVPAAAYIAAIPLLGMYVSSALYVFGVLHVQYRTPLLRGLITAAVVVAALYFLFEATFRVYLPRGWLGNALGF
jgi:hypothetical protein